MLKYLVYLLHVVVVGRLALAYSCFLTNIVIVGWTNFLGGA